MRHSEKDRGFSLIELLIVVIIIMIIAAIAIPSLLRARISANESGVIGDTRTLISGQHAYASANSGLYEGKLVCLNIVTGGGCIPNYPANGPTFLDSNIANQIYKSGYTRSFQPAVGTILLPSAASPTSKSSFVYLSSPASLGRTGVRGFGGDASGVLCTSQTGVAPPTTGDVALLPTPTTCEIFQ